MMVLYEDFSDTKGQEALEELGLRREEVGRELQEAFRILRSLKGGNPTLEEFMELWNTSRKEEFEKLAIRLWLKSNPPAIPLRPGKEHLSVAVPGDAADLWEALVTVRPRTADPTKYWNAEAGRFFGLPVSDEEKEGILGRYVRYARSEEHLKAFRLLEGLAGLINTANRYRSGNTTPASLEATAPWLAKLLQAKKIPHPRYSGHTFEFSPDETLFLEPAPKFRAFDEK